MRCRWMLLLLAAMTMGCGAKPAPAPAPRIIDIGGPPPESVLTETEPEPERHELPNEAALRDPSAADARAPASFRVIFETTKGSFTVELVRKWAPHGVDRFYNLVALGYYDGAAFFRVIHGFIVQFGIHGDPELNRIWREAKIRPDQVVGSNLRGYLSYAMAGRPDTRSVQVFINLQDNPQLDRMGFAPIGRVTHGMNVVDDLFSGYGERASQLQGKINAEGNAFLRREFPKLDYVSRAEIIGVL